VVALLQQLEDHQVQLADLSAAEQLRWGLEKFGKQFAATTSFGIQSAVLLHLVADLQPAVPVYWIDTGYLFPETYRYAAQLTDLLGIHLKVVQPELSAARMEALQGRLWEREGSDDLATYHRLRKIEPLDRAMQRDGVICWASGVRSSQTDNRAAMKPLQELRGRLSLRPLLGWNSRDVYEYMLKHDLPQHPLFEKGYSSVGDWHSSAPDDGLGRSSRFGGRQQECGLHLPGSPIEGAGI
jgi:phosphoadenosine phosphosulfate reductase